MSIFERFRKNRETKEILRLYELIEKEGNDEVIKEIGNQIILCEALSWKDYKLFCRKY